MGPEVIATEVGKHVVAYAQKLKVRIHIASSTGQHKIPTQFQ